MLHKIILCGFITVHSPFKPGVPAIGRHAPGFLKSLLSMNICMCMYVCMPPRPYITSGVTLTLNDWLIIATAFQFRFIALAIDVIDRRGPSNEMRHQLQPKKTEVRLY